MTTYEKTNDYTLLASDDLPSGGTLSRYFNFAACQVVTIFSRCAEMSDKIQDRWSSTAPAATSVSTALTSQMHVQSFSSLDSAQELEQMHALLKGKGGTPPELDVQLTKKIPKNKLGQP